MAKTTAFTRHINPIGSFDNQEDGSVHQSSPAWVLTFINWENRDTQRIKNVSSTAVRGPLVVENDCVSVSINVNKGTLTHSMTATLVMTDVNYETAIAPGDFVIVNMLNWQKDARDVANSARAKKPINGISDGFKGVFKVQGVRRIVSVDPNSGTKLVFFKINGFAFTEFNNMIYFNPYLIDPNQDPTNVLLFTSLIGKDWEHLINEKGILNCQDIISVLIESFIGSGIDDGGRIEKNGIVKSPNVHFFIPALLGNLLGVSGAKAAKDIYNYIFGLQNYSSGQSQTLASGMNPSGLYKKFSRIYYTGKRCSGDSLVKPEFWNQVKTWSILNQYTNSPLNELYTCFRVSPNGRVLPSVVYRQIPFTTEDFKSNLPVTKFLNLPRWKIHPALILNMDIGRDESARVNFVQYFGKSTISDDGAEISIENALGNYVYDIGDVQRSGLRPYVITTQFDELKDEKTTYLSPEWAKIVGDCVIGGHLKFNGSIECAGIVDPIAIGDNLELDDVVYHIEEISHVCSISPTDGRVIFRTSLNLSSGVSTNSNAKGTKYPEMTDTNAYKRRQTDNNTNQILPGVSEEQDVVYRPGRVYPTKDDVNKKNKPFPQPKNGTSDKKISNDKIQIDTGKKLKQE